MRCASLRYSSGTRGGLSSSGPIDTFRNPDCDPDPDNVVPEPFFFTDYFVTVVNASFERVFIDSIEITVLDGGPSVTLDSPKAVEIAPRTAGVIEGVFLIPAGSGAGTTLFYAGSPTADTVTAGTWPLTVEVTATSGSWCDLLLYR